METGLLQRAGDTKDPRCSVCVLTPDDKRSHVVLQSWANATFKISEIVVQSNNKMHHKNKLMFVKHDNEKGSAKKNHICALKNITTAWNPKDTCEEKYLVTFCST